MATIVLKNSSTSTNVPTAGQLVLGELAINTADGKIFMKKSDLSVIDITSTVTGPEIKALYEAEANAFTDALFTKLGGIETAATADQTAAQLLASIKTVDVNGTGGLNAGTLDGNVSGAFLRSNAADTHSGTITPAVNNVTNLGSGALKYANVYATTFQGQATTAQYADLAEMYSADSEIAPGTVVCFGGTAEVTTCGTDADPRVAGIVSTNPAYLMNSEADGVAVALRGRVPCKVSGSIQKGDMLVSDGNGGARAEANPALGTVIAKALENSEGEAVIEVVV